MDFKKALATVALGVGLGAVLLPSAALAVVTVSPGVARPGGTVTISASCNGGINGNASITGPGGYAFNVTLPSMKSGTAGASGTFQVPSASQANGSWNVSVACSDGMHAGSAHFTVSPGGGPAGGDGGKADNGVLLAVGTALVGAAVGGFVLMRRRATVSA